uniref:Uncharacterized protein n=1 Tax=Arundo donax TaxID=35708 RepID=A0A0A9LVV7_ARUDO
MFGEVKINGCFAKPVRSMFLRHVSGSLHEVVTASQQRAESMPLPLS